MTFKLIDATKARLGTIIIIDNEPSIVRSLDKSKTSAHGHMKVRIEALGIFDGKKKVVAVPGHERFEVPMINKLKGQVLSIDEEKASIMDLESFETLDVAIGEDVKKEVKEGDSVEYWEIEGKKIVRRKL